MARYKVPRGRFKLHTNGLRNGFDSRQFPDPLRRSPLPSFSHCVPDEAGPEQAGRASSRLALGLETFLSGNVSGPRLLGDVSNVSESPVRAYLQDRRTIATAAGRRAF